MPTPLHILAVEPFFGGDRRDMLDSIVARSRHRWTVLSLPPRGMSHRLRTAAHWFAGQLALRPVGHVDAVLVSDALNLADLIHLHPPVADSPTAVYFHCNHLPDPARPSVPGDSCLDLPHLESAVAADAIWFNSRYHADAFINAVESLTGFDLDLGPAGTRKLSSKVRHVPPPVDSPPSTIAADDRDPKSVLVDGRDANLELLHAGLRLLRGMNFDLKLTAIGRLDGLDHPAEVVPGSDRSAQEAALARTAIYLSGKIAAPFDALAIQALRLGCRPVLPHTGVYPELLPDSLHNRCLYDMSAESLATHLREAIYLPPRYAPAELVSRLDGYDSAAACRVFDDGLDRLAASPRRSSTRSSHLTG